MHSFNRPINYFNFLYAHNIGSAVVITDASAAKEAHCSIVDDATNVIKVAKKIEDSRIDSIQTNSPSNAPNSATTKKTATTKVKSSKDTVSTAKPTNNSSNQNKNNKKEKKKESKKVDDDFDDVLESFNLTTGINLLIFVYSRNYLFACLLSINSCSVSSNRQ